MYQLCFYVPESHLESVKEAVFNAGGGKLGNYEQCSWQCFGQGQFKPLPGSNPHTGTENQLTKVFEYRVELVCEEACVDAVLIALKQAHPYEEIAYQLFKLENK